MIKIYKKHPFYFKIFYPLSHLLYQINNLISPLLIFIHHPIKQN